MRRYFEIWGIMLRNSLIRELSFKANFILWMIVEVLWFCGQIVFFGIIFGQVDRIGDWSKWEVVLLLGTHQMIAQLFQAFFFVNVSNIPELVRTGKLDSLLVLPIDSQFAVSTKQFGLDSVLNALLGGVVVIVCAFPTSRHAGCRRDSALPRRARLRRRGALFDHAQLWPPSVFGSCALRDWSTATSISSTSRDIRMSFSRPRSVSFLDGSSRS